MADEFNKAHERVRIFKARDVPRDRSIRLYRSAPQEWTLQLRAPMGLGFAGIAGDGKDFVVASADCTLDELRELRDAIDAQIAERAGEKGEV